MTVEGQTLRTMDISNIMCDVFTQFENPLGGLGAEQVPSWLAPSRGTTSSLSDACRRPSISETRSGAGVPDNVGGRTDLGGIGVIFPESRKKMFTCVGF